MNESIIRSTVVTAYQAKTVPEIRTIGLDERQWVPEDDHKKLKK